MADVAGNVVRLSRAEVSEAYRLAQAALAQWLSTGWKGHYANTLNSHHIGKLGELAVEAWTQSNSTWAASPFPDVTVLSVEDITTVKARVEVKCWVSAWWGGLGAAAFGPARSHRWKARQT